MICVAVAGCTKPHSLLGEWSSRADVGKGTLEFRKDCSFRAVRETPMATLVMEGTYDYKGETLRLHVARWGASNNVTMSEDQKRAMDQIFRTDSLSTVSWTDDDHVQLSGSDGQLTTAERLTK